MSENPNHGKWRFSPSMRMGKTRRVKCDDPPSQRNFYQQFSSSELIDMANKVLTEVGGAAFSDPPTRGEIEEFLEKHRKSSKDKTQ